MHHVHRYAPVAFSLGWPIAPVPEEALEGGYKRQAQRKIGVWKSQRPEDMAGND